MPAFKREHIFYFDFECSTDGIHKAYCVCYSEVDGYDGSFYGKDCARKFLDMIPNNSLCYAHNLSYDICFIISHLDRVCDNPIIKDGRTMSMYGVYHKKLILFKDTYSIISTKLSNFPEMFHLETGVKEVFPYSYYTSENTIENQYGDIVEASLCIPEADRDTFFENVSKIAQVDEPGYFDMRKYCEFYCAQDVKILKEGFEYFRKALLEAFELDAYDYVSISSIANRYMEIHCYWPNGNLYDLSNKPRDFMSRCVIGGRCMLRDNEKQKTDERLVDFDAVSLYPSAMNRLYTLEGIPKVLQKDQCNTKYLLSRLFKDDQVEPDRERFISGFFVHVEITKIGKPRHFPLIVFNKDFQTDNQEDADRSANICCDMYVDHIMLEDLIKFQKCELKVIRGYYYDGKRDYTIRDCIRNLFELRLKYKKENNPLQNIIKLLLNSIYGKTILKPINTNIKFVPTDKLTDYIRNRYNVIESTETIFTDKDTGCKFTQSKETKTINKHFNFTPLGVSTLSMSKRIMNEVMCLAEDLDIPIYYQDTDSMHIPERYLDKLSKEYKKKYHRELIGKDLGQFHPDFQCIGDSQNMPVAIHSLFVGKKTYIDMLQDGDKIAFHCRAKGIPSDVVVKTANKLYPDKIQCQYKSGLVYGRIQGNLNEDASAYSIYALYFDLYSGKEIEFDLCCGDKPCFDMKSNYSISTKTKFVRKLKFDKDVVS